MVLLAKWILENNPNARVAIITDRDELDKQIERVFTEVGEAIYRTSSGRDLMSQLGQAKPRLLCSLVHKFGRKDVDDFDAFIKELEAQPSPTVGEVFVFVDECHRTQSGKLHRAMKAMLPNAVFIGFTGTPLLKKDKADQPRGLRQLHPHLQVRRGGRGRRRARSRLRGARHRPAPRLRGQDRRLVRGQDQGPERLAEGRAEEALGHDAEGAQLHARAWSGW